MTTQSTRHRAVAAAALLTATGLTLSGCNNGGAPPTDSTSTASGPSSSTMSQEEQDLADAVEVTKAYYSDQVKGDYRSPARGFVTDDYYEKAEKDLATLRKQPGTWKGKPNKVVWVKGSQRGRQTVTTRVCQEQNRLKYRSGKPVLVNPDGEPVEAGDRAELLVRLVMDESKWKIDDVQYEKGTC